jgi:hypothetical protein
MAHVCSACLDLILNAVRTSPQARTAESAAINRWSQTLRGFVTVGGLSNLGEKFAVFTARFGGFFWDFCG